MYFDINANALMFIHPFINYPHNKFKSEFGIIKLNKILCKYEYSE